MAESGDAQMRRLIILIMLFVVAAPVRSQVKESDLTNRKLPDGRSQAQAIIEDDYKKSRKDAEELLKRSEDLIEELEKWDHNVLSVHALRNVEEIEKIAKRLKKRMKRF